MTELAADLGVLSQREFRVGRAFSKAFEVYSRNAVSFSIVAFLAWLPTGAITLYSINLPLAERGNWLIGAGLLYYMIHTITTAAILYAAFQDMRGLPVKLGESVQHGLRRLLPLVGATILMFLGLWLGLALLIIPGLMLLMRWYLISPVCVVEQKGPLGSLKRSAELTKGSRWKLFAAFLILFIASIVLAAPIALLSTTISPLAALAANGILRSIIGAFGSVLTVVFYHDLRVEKEGVDIESIASVFD